MKYLLRFRVDNRSGVLVFGLIKTSRRSDTRRTVPTLNPWCSITRWTTIQLLCINAIKCINMCTLHILITGIVVHESWYLHINDCLRRIHNVFHQFGIYNSNKYDLYICLNNLKWTFIEINKNYIYFVTPFLVSTVSFSCGTFGGMSSVQKSILQQYGY